MIKVSVLYPSGNSSTFNMNYYLDTHVPMVRKMLGEICRGVAVDQGLTGPSPETGPIYTAMGHLFFDSLEVFQEAFGQHGPTILADMPNYTDIEPIIQISEVMLS